MKTRIIYSILSFFLFSTNALADDKITPIINFITLFSDNSICSNPTNLVAESFSDSIINLSWQDNSDSEISYKIYRWTDEESDALIITAGANQTTIQDSDLQEITTYHYRIKSVCPTKESIGSNQAVAVTQSNPISSCTKHVEVSGAGAICSEAQPCALEYVKQNAIPGDVICLAAGEYGSLEFDSGSSTGVSNDWITYKEKDGLHTAHLSYIRYDNTKKDAYTKFIGLKIDPGYQVSSSSYNGVINLKGANHIYFKDCQIEGEKISGAPTTPFSPYIFSDNVVVTAGVNPGDASYITFDGCIFRYGMDQLYVKEDSRTPENHVENWTVINCDFSIAGNDNVNLSGSTSGHYLKGNYFHDQNQFKSRFCWQGSFAGDFSGKTWQTMTQDNTNASALFFFRENGNCAGQSGDIIYLLADDPLHTPSRSTTDIWRLDSDPSGVYFTPAHTGDNAHIDMLTFQGAVADVIVERNKFEDTQYGSQIIKLDPLYGENGSTSPRRLEIFNNLLFRNSDVGVVGYMLLVQGAMDVHVYNNIIDTGDNSPFGRGLRLLERFPGTMNLYFHNNIISGAVFSSGSMTSDYNIWFSTPPAQIQEGTNSKIISTDYENLFIDRDTFDYRLSSGSQAVDSANANLAPPTDYLGQLRDEAPDIGPYEY